MPRDGSSNLPAGAAPPAPMNIGEVANPPFAVLPDPASVFLRRSERLAALAPGHQIEAYMRFLSALTRAQHEVQQDLPQPVLPPSERIQQAREHSMPPVSPGQVELDDIADQTFVGIARLLQLQDLGDAARFAIDRVLAASVEARRQLMQAVLLDEIPEDAIAEHVLAAAAVQVHFARLAAQLDAEALTRVADGACPSCGGAPVSSMVVGWEGAHGTRFCTCSICATQWHAVRIRCLVCGSESGIAYHSIDGGSDLVMGETCESCSSYVKMLHQHKDAALDPVADDVASLGLDLVLQKEGWQRASVNPFLMGY